MEIVQRARRVLAPPLWDYLVGGAETETTLFRNREALAAWAFRPRILRDVADVDTTTTLLGHRLALPLLFAPIGSLQNLTPDGTAASVRAAERYGALAVVSSVSQPELEVAAAAGEDKKWFQLYVRGDDAWIDGMVERVQRAGYRALIMTVDVAHYGHRERQILNGWVAPSRRDNVDTERFQALLTWEQMDRIKRNLSIPLGIKGIQTGEDAALALEHGADVVWVSNHGGRQLDHVRGTADMLPEIAAAVAGRAPIVVDGGYFRGPDLLKAFALGASAVAIGKLEGLALAAGGADALVRTCELLEFEVRTAMALLGVTAVAQLGRSYVERIPTGADTRAFPLVTDGLVL